jgi:hypothetical protein
MKNEEFKKVIEGIQGKLGKEASGVIADDLGTLISDNITMNKTITEKDDIIKEKEDLNQKLVFANSSLLQQVGVPAEGSEENKKSSSKSEEKKEISWKDCFDKKGNFIR